MKPLTGRTALVTGAAKRIGREMALALAGAGAHVAAHYQQSEAEALALADELRSMGVQAWTFQADLARPDAVESLYDRVTKSCGQIDLLINSASIFPRSTLQDFSAEDLYQCIDVNAYAPLVLGRRMAAAGHEGAIVNMLDCMIADYDKLHAAYHLSKRMLFTITRMMAVEFAPVVRVNAVAPGLVLPPVGKDEAYLQRLASSNPLNRYGAVDDVTAATLFLLRSEFVTGQVIFVDGGRHMRGSMYG